MIADSWNNINAIPTNFNIDQELQKHDLAECFFNISKTNQQLMICGYFKGVLSYLWKIVLLTAAAMNCNQASIDTNKVSDTMLLRMIKDAVDNGIDNVIDFRNLMIQAKSDQQKSETNGAINTNIQGTLIEHYPILQNGVPKLMNVFVNHKNTWSKLPNNVKQHKMRKKRAPRCDSRYDDEYGFDQFDMMSSFGGFGRRGGWFEMDERVNLLNAVLGRRNGRRNRSGYPWW